MNDALILIWMSNTRNPQVSNTWGFRVWFNKLWRKI